MLVLKKYQIWNKKMMGKNNWKTNKKIKKNKKAKKDKKGI
jgi:hypothetical protein